MGRMGGIIRNLTKTPVNGPLLRTTKQAILKDTAFGVDKNMVQSWSGIYPSRR